MCCVCVSLCVYRDEIRSAISRREQVRSFSTVRGLPALRRRKHERIARVVDRIGQECPGRAVVNREGLAADVWAAPWHHAVREQVQCAASVTIQERVFVSAIRDQWLLGNHSVRAPPIRGSRNAKILGVGVELRITAIDECHVARRQHQRCGISSIRVPSARHSRENVADDKPWARKRR